MRGLFVSLVVFLALQGALAGPHQKRRKIRRKILKQPVQTPPEVTVLQSQPIEVVDNLENINQNVEQSSEDDRNARGFLDDYYAQFEKRVFGSQVDRSGMASDNKNANADVTSNSRMDLGNVVASAAASGLSPDYYDDASIEDFVSEARGMPEYTMARRKKVTIMEPTVEEVELYEIPTTVQQQQPELLKSRYVQHVALPDEMPGDNTYMYSSVLANQAANAGYNIGNVLMTAEAEDPMVNEVVPAKSVASYVYAKPEHKHMPMSMPMLEDKVYTTSPYLSATDQLNTRLFNSGSSGGAASLGSSLYSDATSTSSSTDPVSRFFGVTGTTSQDIQLGLTFTVPFLTIPLNSLQSMIGGGGLGDLFDFGDFDTSNLLIVGVIALAAIFVLPQVIYWATGVNLSAFNWGRSEDGHGYNVATLMNTIDEGLKKYDVDTRTCLARTMCNQYARKTEDENIGRINRGLVENLADNAYVKKYVGESAVNEALTFASKGQGDCSSYYTKDVCPWDTSAMIKIASKVISNGNVDFASIATAAAANLVRSKI